VRTASAMLKNNSWAQALEPHNLQIYATNAKMSYVLRLMTEAKGADTLAGLEIPRKVCMHTHTASTRASCTARTRERLGCMASHSHTLPPTLLLLLRSTRSPPARRTTHAMPAVVSLLKSWSSSMH
jgi:hypothetical protein